MDTCETNRDHVVRDLRYLKSYGKVSNNQEIYEIAESALELLKEQEEQKRKWLQTIADNQLANAPIETMNASQQTYSDGVWHGLQMAYEILDEET